MVRGAFGWFLVALMCGLVACETPEAAVDGGTAGTGGAGAFPGGGEGGDRCPDFYGCPQPPRNDPPVRMTDFDTTLDPGRLIALVYNPFVMAAYSPFSAFAPNLNIGSYDAFIAVPALPSPRTAIRVEDFVNAFDYLYAAPSADAEHPVAITLDAAPHPFGRTTLLLRVAVQATKALDTPRPPANVVFVIRDARPIHAWSAQIIRDAALSMNPTDTVAIVSAADDGAGRVRLAPTDVMSLDVIEAALVDTAEIDAGVVTDGDAGAGDDDADALTLAYQQAAAGQRMGSVNHVVVLDSSPTTWGSPNSDIASPIAQQRRAGITLSTVTYSLSEPIAVYAADAGGGRATMLRREDQMAGYVQAHLMPFLAPAARDVEIAVEVNPSLVRAHRLLGYERYASPGTVGITPVTAVTRDIGVGHQVTALYELVLEDDAVPMPAGALPPIEGTPVTGTRSVGIDELVRATLLYRAPDAPSNAPRTQVVQGMTMAGVAASAKAIDIDFEWTAAVATLAELLRMSPFPAATEFRLAQSLIVALADRDRDPDRSELADKIRQWSASDLAP